MVILSGYHITTLIEKDTPGIFNIAKSSTKPSLFFNAVCQLSCIGFGFFSQNMRDHIRQSFDVYPHQVLYQDYMTMLINDQNHQHDQYFVPYQYCYWVLCLSFCCHHYYITHLYHNLLHHNFA